LTFFKFTPELLTEDELESISVGRNELVNYVFDKVQATSKSKKIVNLVFIGPRGIGKTHLLLRIYHKLSKLDNIVPIRLSEEEYSITNIESFFQRILEISKNKSIMSDTIIDDTREYFKKNKNNGKHTVLFVENLQMLFEQLESDLPKLRSIILEDQSFSIIGTATSTFEHIISPKESFYNFFEPTYLHGLNEDEVKQLIKKRLEFSKKTDLIESLERNSHRIKGLQLLTGGIPRLIHILSEIIIQKNSFEGIEQNLLKLLDELSPLYQSRMETMSIEKRRILDTLALADGPLSPTEISNKLNLKKPASVVTQLKRLKDEGYVELIKFKTSRGVRYQISDRLYRIWREMRVSGYDKLNLLIQFLQIWYDTTELQEKLIEKSNEVNHLMITQKDKANVALKDMCYFMNALGGPSFMQIKETMKKCVQLGNFQIARSELAYLEKSVDQESEKPIKNIMALFILVGKIELTQNKKEKEEILKELFILADKLSKIKITKNIKKYSKTLHPLYEMAADYLTQYRNYELAEKCSQIALDVDPEWCVFGQNQHAVIKFNLKKYEEAMKIVDKVLKKDPENELALLTKMNLYAIQKNPKGVKEITSSVIKDLELIRHVDNTYRVLNLNDEFINILTTNIPKIKNQELVIKHKIVNELFNSFIHYLCHYIKLQNNEYADIEVKKIKVLDEILNPEIIVNSVVENIRIFGPDSTGLVSELYLKLKHVLNSENQRVLLPIEYALNFIETQDVEIFEKMHKELRQLVIDIIKSISPEIKLPKLIEESVL
jgi:uncharacterized protein